MQYLKPSGDPRQPQHAPAEEADLFTRPKDDLTEAFLVFHRANPHVYVTLRDLALEWKVAGKRRCGMSLLYNTVRWRLSLEIEGDGTFELNDHFQPFYARALMHFEPELDGMFELRRAAQADAWIAQYQVEDAA